MGFEQLAKPLQVIFFHVLEERLGFDLDYSFHSQHFLFLPNGVGLEVCFVEWHPDSFG